MRKHQIQSYLSPVVCLLVSFVLGSAVLAVSGYSPMTAYQALLVNALGTKNGILQTLLKASPLIFCGLSAAVALRAGVFNIGIEGQLYIGAFAGFLAGRYLTGLPPWLHIPLCILTGALAGALYALIPAILKQRTGAHEVVTTIMLNYVAVLFTSYLSNHSFKAEGMMPQTELVQASARISRIVPQSQLTWAIVAAVVFLGTHGRFIQDFASGAGYQGVSIAILGGNSPVGVGLASLLFGVLQYGGTAMSRTTGVPAEFTEVIQALVVLCVSAPVLVQVLFREGGERKGERS